MEILFHITSAAEAARAQTRGDYQPEGFAREGFVHCSFRHQVTATAGRYYRGRDDLVLLEIDPSALAGEVVVEDLTGRGESFPHVYGHLPWAAVRAVHPFPCRGDGTFELPGGVRAQPRQLRFRNR